jgi:acetyl esterase/lipase
MELVVPLLVTPFPVDTEVPDGVEIIFLKDRDGYGTQVTPDVKYDERDGEELVLQIITPVVDEKAVPVGSGTAKKWPLIVYVPGSGWKRQNVYTAFDNMLRMAEKGFAVAIVEYRGTDISQFPSAIEDTKTAIRYMKTNAAKYGIDADKIAVWGDSSGDHSAVMAGITGDDEFNTGAYADVSASVNVIVDWYGPTDISVMSYYPSVMDWTLPDSLTGMLIGKLNVLENPEAVSKTNPINYLAADKAIPPILLMHGSQDILVPFNQSVRLYEKLRELNKTVTFYKVEGGNHGSGGFMGDDALELVAEYIRRQLG